ncbi:hypothetical protein [Coleofasciculus sp. E1-EBD-02]|uniref:hypothetical protein n=1 Tax=Coleofasciculus sp. E1-EBD-02 TaxID=3068481 RepID=UPI0032FE2ED3
MSAQSNAGEAGGARVHLPEQGDAILMKNTTAMPEKLGEGVKTVSSFNKIAGVLGFNSRKPRRDSGTPEEWRRPSPLLRYT